MRKNTWKYSSLHWTDYFFRKQWHSGFVLRDNTAKAQRPKAPEVCLLDSLASWRLPAGRCAAVKFCQDEIWNFRWQSGMISWMRPPVPLAMKETTRGRKRLWTCARRAEHYHRDTWCQGETCRCATTAARRHCSRSASRYTQSPLSSSPRSLYTLPPKNALLIVHLRQQFYELVGLRYPDAFFAVHRTTK